MSTTEIDTPNTRRNAAVAADGETAAQPVSVVILDDDPAASYSLRALLSWRPDIRGCALAGSADAIEAVERELPDVCLVSAALGPRFIHRLTQLRGGPHVLAYSDRRDPGWMRGAAGRRR